MIGAGYEATVTDTIFQTPSGFFIKEIFSLKRDTLSLVYDGLIPVAKATTGYPRR